jgi:hypothetical protein
MLASKQSTVDFYSKNKFEKLVHLVGFIIRIYHDARSSECQTSIIISELVDEPSGLSITQDKSEVIRNVLQTRYTLTTTG